MNNIWIGIAILMNACSASYLYILLNTKISSNQDKTNAFITASLCWYAVSILFLMPYFAGIFLNSIAGNIILLLLTLFIITTAVYHLVKLTRLYPKIKKQAFSYLVVLFILAVFFNVFYSLQLSKFLLHITTGAVIIASLIGLKRHDSNLNSNDIQLGSSYVLGGLLLQIGGLAISNAQYTELIQAMLLASVPLIMYGFGFIALEKYNYTVSQHMQRIHLKSTELEEAYNALYQTSHYDQHTGLRNAHHFDLDIDTARINSDTWAGLINLTNFKGVNDALGYQNGDSVLKDLSSEIHAFLPPTSALYRMSGDRFAFIHASASKQSTIQLCHNIQSQLKTYSVVNELPFVLSANIGITELLENKTLEIIHQELELSMSTASHSKEERHAVFDQSLLDNFIKNNLFKENLKTATKNQDWSLYFQPQISIETGHICGAEILIRWETKDGKIVSPGDFIPLAESIGLLNNIGIAVIEKSFSAIEKLNTRGYDHIKYAINLSGPQFMDLDTLDTLIALKDVHNIPDGQVILEICETVFIENFEEAGIQLSNFSDQGFLIALDDFGTGYSSLRYLSNLAVDEIKFDKSFVDSVNTDLKAKKILATMINLSKQLELRHVIEGVETDEQLRAIQSIGGEIYQGYYFSKPVTHDALESILEIMRTHEFTA